MTKNWNIEQVTREGDALRGEIASMGAKFDEPWMWRLMLGQRVIDSGRAGLRDEAITDLLDAWDDLLDVLDVHQDLELHESA